MNEELKEKIVLGVVLIFSIGALVNSIAVYNYCTSAYDADNSYYIMQQEAFDKHQEIERQIGEWLDEVAVPCENCSVIIEAYYS